MNMGQLYREVQRSLNREKVSFYGRPTGEPYHPQEILQVVNDVITKLPE